jgi:hypothetical protein
MAISELFKSHNLNFSRKPNSCTTKGVSHFGLAIYILKVSQGKRRIMGIQIFFTMQKYNLQRNPLRETQILQDIITL